MLPKALKLKLGKLLNAKALKGLAVGGELT
jgi:hypothetical protein